MSTDTLTDDTKTIIRDAVSALRRNTPGFKDRPGQRLMIAEVARALSGYYGRTRIAAIEAPTGVGKSIGYSTAAIPIAQAHERTLIISTATVALQEQLVERDLPRLRKASGLDFSFMLAKGRGRYVCNRNLAQLAGTDARQAELGFEERSVAAWDFLPDERERNTVYEMERQLADRAWDGDLDNWPSQVPERVRPLLVTDQHGCTGRACPFIHQCVFQRARADLKQSDVVVANHNLVMADLNLGGGYVLPSPEESYYVFDEAHHLPDVARDNASSEVQIRGSLSWLRKLPGAFRDVLALMSGKNNAKAAEKMKQAEASISELSDMIKDAETLIRTNFPADLLDKSKRKPWQRSEVITWRFPMGEVPRVFEERAREIGQAAGMLVEMLTAEGKALKKAVTEGLVPGDRAVKPAQALGFMVGRLENLRDAWSLFGAGGNGAPGEPPVARWIDHIEGQKGKQNDLRIAASVTSVADFLRSALFEQAAGVILTSATLTALGRFDRMVELMGLSRRDGTQYLRLASPFSYEEKAELYIPAMKANPSHPAEHTKEVVRQLEAHIDPGQGTLVLFSSRKQMNDVAEGLAADLREQVLVQGTQSKQALLAEHQGRIEAGQGSVLFGLASFAEGLDLPGRLCEHVIIAKLPFSVPDSPVEATYAEWLEARGRNPFMEISVPDAGVKLVQACGRLIRSESDQGRVTLLDRRVLTKRYGKALLDGLPPFRRNFE